MSTSRRSFWARLSIPLRIGLGFAAAGIVLAIIGILRGNVPTKPISIFLALLISGGSWGIVSWAVATAVVDVERDVAEASEEDATAIEGAGEHADEMAPVPAEPAQATAEPENSPVQHG